MARNATDKNSIYIPYFPDLKETSVTINYDDNDTPVTVTLPWWWFKAVLIYAADVEAAAQQLQAESE